MSLPDEIFTVRLANRDIEVISLREFEYFVNYNIRLSHTIPNIKGFINNVGGIVPPDPPPEPDPPISTDGTLYFEILDMQDSDTFTIPAISSSSNPATVVWEDGVYEETDISNENTHTY